MLLQLIFIRIFNVQIECTETLYYCRSSLKHLPQDIDSWVLVPNYRNNDRHLLSTFGWDECH